MKNKSILKDSANAAQLLSITSDTLILLNKEGVCVDIDIHNTDLWFMNERFLLGKNLLKLLPYSTYESILQAFRAVLIQNKRQTGNYSLIAGGLTYYFKCIMYPYQEGVLCQYRDITERSQQKLELIKKNRELNEIQRIAQVRSWEFDGSRKVFRYYNSSSITDKDDVDEISIEDYRATIVPEDKNAFDKWIAHNLSGNLEDSITFRIHSALHISYYRLKCYARERDKNGVVLLEGYAQNITDIQQSRNDINLLTHAINNCTEDIYAVTEDGIILLGNRKFRERHHLSKQAISDGTHIYHLSTYARDKAGWEVFAQTIKEGKITNPYVVEKPIVGHPEVLAIEANSYWVTGDNGMGSIWTFGHDISDRLRGEQAAERFYQILNKTIDNLPAGIVVKDIEHEFKYLYSNRASILGTNDNSFIGKSDFEILPEAEARRKREQDMKVATTGIPMHWIEEVRLPDGSIKFIDKQKIKIESNDFSPILVSINWDITDMERMKRELIEAKEKAEVNDQLKSAFLANMSHEIRTPLNAIIGFSRVIAESENLHERKEYYKVVEQNNERLLKLINEILDLSKIEAGMVDFTISPIRLNRLSTEVYEALKLRCPDGVELIAEHTDEDLLMETDKNRLFQVLSNLIGNAYKFTSKGSVRYGYKKVEQAIIFHVSDTGSGITPEKIDKVFDRFVKANDFVQGTGLGLSICKTIIERLGGHIEVSSTLGRGTTFTFSLPQFKSMASPKRVDHLKNVDILKADYLNTELNQSTDTNTAPDHPSENSELSAKTILVAEDTDCNYMLLKAILGNIYHLERAKDGMEAVTMFNNCRPDLILMDMKMPNLNGLDATRIIRELSSDVPIIALTAYAYEQDKRAAFDAGCNDFLAKPFKQEELMNKITGFINL